MRLKLNTKKIKKECDRLGWTQTTLAEKVGWSRQKLNYNLQKKLIINAADIGKALDIHGRDLII